MNSKCIHAESEENSAVEVQFVFNKISVRRRENSQQKFEFSSECSQGKTTTSGKVFPRIQNSLDGIRLNKLWLNESVKICFSFFLFFLALPRRKAENGKKFPAS
jgi:hypothetical protein